MKSVRIHCAAYMDGCTPSAASFSARRGSRVFNRPCGSDLNRGCGNKQWLSQYVFNRPCGGDLNRSGWTVVGSAMNEQTVVAIRAASAVVSNVAVRRRNRKKSRH